MSPTKYQKSFKVLFSLHVHVGQGDKMAFEKPLHISVKHIDLSSGLEIINSLSEELTVSRIVIRRSSHGV